MKSCYGHVPPIDIHKVPLFLYITTYGYPCWAYKTVKQTVFSSSFFFFHNKNARMIFGWQIIWSLKPHTIHPTYIIDRHVEFIVEWNFTLHLRFKYQIYIHNWNIISDHFKCMCVCMCRKSIRSFERRKEKKKKNKTNNFRTFAFGNKPNECLNGLRSGETEMYQTPIKSEMVWFIFIRFHKYIRHSRFEWN